MTKLTTATLKENFRQVFNLFDIKNLTFDDHLQLYLWLLRALGLGFLDDDYYKTMYPFYGTLSTLVVTYVVVSDVFFIKQNIDNVSMTTECLTTLLLGIVLLLKIAILCYFRKELRSLVNEMRIVYNFAKSSSDKEWKIMLNRLQEARIVTRIFYYASITVTITFVCCTLPKYESRALPMPARGVGIEGDDIVSYVINFLVQIWAMIIVTHLMPGYESVLIYALLIQCGHLEILAYRLESIGRGNEFYGKTDEDESIDWENVDFQSDAIPAHQFLEFKYSSVYLRDCFQMHQKIYSFADNMAYVYTSDCLCEIVFSTLVGCVSLYQITEANSETLIAIYLYIGCCTLQIFVYCWYGDLLKEKSLGICEAIGKIPWYLLHPSQRKDLQIMLIKAQKPITLSALFVDLTLECFTMIMKSTYSYYTVLTSSEDE